MSKSVQSVGVATAVQTARSSPYRNPSRTTGVVHHRIGGSQAGTEARAEVQLDVAACLKRIKRRDETAASALVNHLYPLVIKIVRAYGSRQAEAQDLAQMVFAKVFLRLRQYAGAVPLEHWVARITVNTCLNQLRAERKRPELRWADLTEEQAALVEKLVATADDPRPGERLAARELAERMLAALTPADRLVVSLLDLEERSVAEVCQVTGWGASMVKVRAFRARRKLRKQFGQLWKEHKP